MRTWLEINKKNLIHNAAIARRFLKKKTKLLAVVKSNAYGHGLKEVSSVLKTTVDWFGVANLEESLKLSDYKVSQPILILSHYDLSKNICLKAIKRGIQFPLYNKNQLGFLNQLGASLKIKIPVHLKIDSGTSRIGILAKDFSEFYREIQKSKFIEINGIYSHFADSEENKYYTEIQINRFSSIVSHVKKQYPKTLSHIACSASLVSYPHARFDMVRAGIMLYGLSSSKKLFNVGLQPVMQWKTRIIDVKNLEKGTPVGYGLTYRAKNKMTLAVLPVGYADGYDRLLSNNSRVLVDGKFAQVVGRICMNLMMIDSTKANARLGNEAILLGGKARKEITASELADNSKTTHYEIITRINWEIPRILV